MTDFKEDDILRKNFSTYYQEIAILKENKNRVQRYFSGITMPYLNAVMGYPFDSSQWDECITEELQFFQAAGYRFVWYLDETDSKEFKEKLLLKGFTNEGVLRGMVGPLDLSTFQPRIPEGYSLEFVQDEGAMAECNELICLIFGIPDLDKSRHQSFLWQAAQTTPQLLDHWVVRKGARVVSALTTLIDRDLVSFWNGATLPEERRKGLSTALRALALKKAMARGCTLGASYLRSEGMALGICTNLGFRTKWRFEAFLSPAIL